MKESFEIRRFLFEDHARCASHGYIDPPPFGVRYPCPCCGYPTLKVRGIGQVCLLCLWEDSGLDDPDDDPWNETGVEVEQGSAPPWSSLGLARRNFELYGSVYDPGEVAPGASGDQSPIEREAKQATIEAFDDMLYEKDRAMLRVLWNRVHNGERVLERELHGRCGLRQRRLSY